MWLLLGGVLVSWVNLLVCGVKIVGVLWFVIRLGWFVSMVSLLVLINIGRLVFSVNYNVVVLVLLVFRFGLMI